VQGADEKTRVAEHTRNVLFYGYGVPGVENRHLTVGLTLAAETMKEFGGGSVAGVEVFVDGTCLAQESGSG
jgi:DNA/RNA-binding domain of Phe-tRNA-synthetase-like protein